MYFTQTYPSCTVPCISCYMNLTQTCLFCTRTFFPYTRIILRYIFRAKSHTFCYAIHTQIYLQSAGPYTLLHESYSHISVMRRPIHTVTRTKCAGPYILLYGPYSDIFRTIQKTQNAFPLIRYLTKRSYVYAFILIDVVEASKFRY